LPGEKVPLAAALERILAEDIRAPIDVPGFDRANVDGFVLRAEDTFGSDEQHPRRLELSPESIAPGHPPRAAVQPGTASAIATGGMIPRGADAVVMVEHTETVGGHVFVRRPVAPGTNITFTATDIGQDEMVLRQGMLLTSRETGILAALGIAAVPVIRRPRVAILSTGDELVPPGRVLEWGQIFDSNSTIVADAVRELGGEPVFLGIVPDDPGRLKEQLRQALASDLVLLSGGTSKGAGDIAYRVVAELGSPGIIVHGVALKPGKPLCLAAVGKTPVIILPGFPTSAIFTFHEFAAPIIRRLAGRSAEERNSVRARLPMRVPSERGRTEYVLVSLVSASGADSAGLLSAYPMGKGSGSVTTYSMADGFFTIPRNQEYLEAGEEVEVQLLGKGLAPADLISIGSHCVGLDFLMGLVHEQGYRTKFLAVGSIGGLAAARRGECDLAGIHLLDPATETYNRPFVTDELILLEGYGRLQGIVFRPDDGRFQGRAVADAVAQALADPSCQLVNRNRGSGTRILIDQLLGQARPPGYAAEVRSHNAVAAAVAQGRADWGVCIESVAAALGLGFLPLKEEHYDFVVPRTRWQRPAVQCFRAILERPETRKALKGKGLASRPLLP
jgi:putative molybdopterin biosynthesis protein